MLFMCCCALTLFDKASEIFFSMRANNPAVAHKHIFSKNYNSWRNFNLMYLFFERFFGKGAKSIISKSVLVLSIVTIGFFCFYCIYLLGFSGIMEIISPNDQNINLEHWFTQAMVQAGVLIPIMPGYVKISYLSLIPYEIVILAPVLFFVALSFISNIIITGRLLQWLAVKRRPFWQTGGGVLGCTIGTFLVEILMLVTIFLLFYLLSFVSNSGISQEGKYNAVQHRAGWGVGLEIGSHARLGGRVWSDPVFTQNDLNNAKAETWLLDAFTSKYNGSSEKKIEYRGLNDSEESAATCEFAEISQVDCVKKVRNMFFERIRSNGDRPTGHQMGFSSLFLEISSAISPYVCSATSRSAIAGAFAQDWEKTMVELAVVPIYVALAIYISRLIFSTIIPFAVIVDFIVIKQARVVYSSNKMAQSHLLRHFGYFSLLPIAASIWLIGRLSSLFC